MAQTFIFFVRMISKTPIYKCVELTKSKLLKQETRTISVLFVSYRCLYVADQGTNVRLELPVNNRRHQRLRKTWHKPETTEKLITAELPIEKKQCSVSEATQGHPFFNNVTKHTSPSFWQV